MQKTTPKSVALWLAIVAGWIALTLLIGGLTRLAGAGLSITQWQPLTGILPPLNAQEWQEAFALYQAIPQFRLANPDMNLAGFQVIYWWEWAHRIIARGTGLVFAVPFFWFAWRGVLSRPHLLFLSCLLVLGGLQGLVGWLMVQSGLQGERIAVAPHWLSAHLLLALVLYMACLLGAQQIASNWRITKDKFLWALLGAVFLQAGLGALLAGGMSALAWHQWFGYGLVAFASWHYWHRKKSGAVFALLLVQVSLGLFLLWLGIPHFLALLHQLMVLLILFVLSRDLLDKTPAPQ